MVPGTGNVHFNVVFCLEKSVAGTHENGGSGGLDGNHGEKHASGMYRGIPVRGECLERSTRCRGFHSLRDYPRSDWGS